MVATPPDEDGTLLGPVEVKGRPLSGGPHAMLVQPDQLTLVQLPGRSRLWIVVLPGVLLAWFVRGLLPQALPETTMYVLFVILLFYAGDHWSKTTTQRAMDDLTTQQAAANPETRIPLDQLQRTTTKQPLFGDREVTLETPSDTWRIEVDGAQWARLEPVLDRPGLEHD